MACSVDAKLLKSTKFPPEFNQKVDMEKVNAEVIKKWIASKISEILGNDDDVVIELCFNLIEGSRYPDIKKTQIQLTGFLDKDTPSFCKELWKLCLSAQTNPQGVPKELLEAKKQELIQEKIEAGKTAEEARRRREEEDERREREIGHTKSRENELEDRGTRSGRRDSWRAGRGGRDGDRKRIDRHSERSDTRDFDRRPRRYSRSPTRQRNPRDQGSFRPTRKSDTYIPNRRINRRRPSISRSRSSSITRSRSRSLLFRRGRSSSKTRSPTPRRRSKTPPRRADLYRGRSDRYRRGRSMDRRTRRRSPSLSGSLRSRSCSQSRSPRTFKRRRYKSHTPGSSPRRTRRVTSSRSRSSISSRSPSLTPRRRRPRSRARTKNSLTSDTDDDKACTQPASRRGREPSEQQLTQGNSRNKSPFRGRRSPCRSPCRSSRRSSHRSRSHHSPNRSRTRSTSRTRIIDGGVRKRRRSIQYYEPVNRRRQKTSTVLSPIDKRESKADFCEDDRRSSQQDSKTSKNHKTIASNEESDRKNQSNEKRERILREKIKQMRKSRISP